MPSPPTPLHAGERGVDAVSCGIPASAQPLSPLHAGESPATGDPRQWVPVGGGDEISSWQVIGASVRGAAHVRSGLPNQDAIAWIARGGRGAVLAVADGHGSAKCFRSDVGARLAVEAAVETLHRLAKLVESPPEVADLADPCTLRRAAEALHRRWVRGVGRELIRRPLGEVELASLERREGSGARRQVERNPRLAFGATVLAALVTAEHVLYLQLGDGDILAVAADGTVARPVPPDSRLFGNATTSLCAYDAVDSFRFGVQPLEPAGDATGAAGGTGGPPVLILLSTDGYANSFRDDAGFTRVGADLLEIVRSEGVAAVEAGLEAWLAEASRFGSGDDVTVGVLCRTPNPSPPAPLPETGEGSRAASSPLLVGDAPVEGVLEEAGVG